MECFKYIPSDIYKEILFLADPEDIVNLSIINKYALQICDNSFYKEYIKTNFKQSFDKSDIPNNLTGKIVLHMLIKGITVSCEAMNIFEKKSIIKFNFTVFFEDTLNDIFCRINCIMRNKFYLSYVYKIIIIGKVDHKNVALILDVSNNYTDQLDISTDVIISSIETINTLGYKTDSLSFSSAQLIRKILPDSWFYFSIFKIWVYVICFN
jgi:hypothetical protein